MIKFNKNRSGGMLVATTDGGAGSSGKGCLNSWIADKYEFDVSINNWMSNAGHFTELDDGTRILVQHIPSAFVDKNIELYINAGAAIDMEIFTSELKMLNDLGYDISSRLKIHPHANVITDRDKELEKATIKSGSTFKGCGAALSGKTMRRDRKLAKDYDELSEFIEDRTYNLNLGLSKGMKILVEGSQGVDLDINHAEYPFTTSRQTTPSQLIADAGLPCQATTNVIINLRTNPIRINNQSAANAEETCYTGNYWDAKEISWEDIAEQAGLSYSDFLEKYDFSMMTSVTKKVRRIFSFPIERMKYVHALCGGLLPDSNVMYSLNFINFIDDSTAGATTIDDVMTDKVIEWLDNNLFASINRDSLKWIRTGAKHSQIVELPNGC